jgi:dihydrofolate reductase
MPRREVVLQMHTTLDGSADSKNGFVPIKDRAYWRALDRAFALTAASEVDTLLLGKGTYKQFAGFWPKVASDPAFPKGMREQAKFLDETPKIVFSKTLRSANWKNSTIVRGDVAREIARLKRQPGKNMMVPGGVAFPRALIERDLIDEYLLSVVPIIVGQTQDRLFGQLPRQRSLRHLRSWTFDNGVTLHQLRRAK